MKKLIFISLTLIVVGICSTSCTKDEVTESSLLTNKANKTKDDKIKHDKSGEDDDPLPIRGKVKNQSGTNLDNVHVELFTTGLSFIDEDHTDNNGVYEIPDVTPDTYKLVFNKSGYQELTKTIEVGGGTSFFDVGNDTLIVE